MEVDTENPPVAVPSSPWGKISQPSSVTSLTDIMSEQLAKDLHEKEVKSYVESNTGLSEASGIGNIDLLESSEGCDSDMMIAQMLQLQFDKEHDEMLKRTEAKFNGTSKVCITYDNFKATDQKSEDSDSDDGYDVDDSNRHWDTFEASEAAFPSIPRCGYRRSAQGSEIVTKHDITMANRRNACRVMEFPPEFQTGDGGGFDMKLSNQVFNSLKRHSRIEQGRRARLHDKSELATSEQAVDARTRLLLHKWVDSGLLESVGGILSSGKEAVVLHAEGGKREDGTEVPKACAAKIFKTTLNEFKEREKYIKDDYRFRDKYSKQNTRKLIELWAEKEMRNLIRMKKAGVFCPEVVQLKKHVLLMEYIGDDKGPALKLKDVILGAADLALAYEQVVQGMKDMYHGASLVHADLSEYNILWLDGRCWFIDVGQAVEPKHPGARGYLLRDCNNISNFFGRKGLAAVASAEALFQEVTGLTGDPTQRIQEANFKLQIEAYERDHERLTHQEPSMEYPFEECWEKSQRQSSKEAIDTPIN